MMSLPVWLTGPMLLLGVSVQEGFLSRGFLSKGVSVQDGSLSREFSVQRGSLFRGSLSRRFSVQGVSVRGTPPTQNPLYTVTSGWYESYWNAFLLEFVMIR